MKHKKDYYKILKLTPSATSAEIRNMYRRLAILKHPDRDPSPQATAEMQDINEAYSVLGNENKRKQYDLEHIGNIPYRNNYSTRQTTKATEPSVNFLQQLTERLKVAISSIASIYQKNKYSDNFKELTKKIKFAFIAFIKKYKKNNVKHSTKESETPPDIYEQIKEGVKIIFISLAIIEILLLIALIFIALS